MLHAFAFHEKRKENNFKPKRKKIKDIPALRDRKNKMIICLEGFSKQRWEGNNNNDSHDDNDKEGIAVIRTCQGAMNES